MFSAKSHLTDLECVVGPRFAHLMSLNNIKRGVSNSQSLELIKLKEAIIFSILENIDYLFGPPLTERSRVYEQEDILND